MERLATPHDKGFGLEIGGITGDTPLAGLRRRRKLTPVVVLLFALLVLGITIGGIAMVAFGDRSSTVDTFDPATHVRKGPSARAVAIAKLVSQWTATDPGQLRKVSADDARRLNEDVPVATGGNAPATPMALPAKGNNLAAGLDCMTAAIYYEAANEPIEGQRAVAQVILNRVRHPAYPKTVCGVVYQGVDKGVSCQFTFVCDGSLARAPVPALWRQARVVAAASLGGMVYGPVGWSTHYHADYVFPYWAPTLVKALVIGRHIFYRMPGGMGTKGAFSGRYLADEWGQIQRAQQQERVLLANMPGRDALLAENASMAANAAAPTQRGVLLPSGAQAAPAGGATPSVPAPAAPAVAAPDRYVLGTNGGSLK